MTQRPLRRQGEPYSDWGRAVTCLLRGCLNDWSRHSELTSVTSTSRTHLVTQDPTWVLGSLFPTPDSAHHLGRSESLFLLPCDVSPSSDNPFGGPGLPATFPVMHTLTNPLGTPTQGWGPGGLPSRVRGQVMTIPRVLQ